MSDKLMILMYGALVAILLGGMFLLFQSLEASCEEKGGHLGDYYRDLICVSEDGRILR